MSKYDVHFLGRITPFAKLQIHFNKKAALNIQIYWIFCFNFCVKLFHGNNINNNHNWHASYVFWVYLIDKLHMFIKLYFMILMINIDDKFYSLYFRVGSVRPRNLSDLKIS